MAPAFGAPIRLALRRRLNAANASVPPGEDCGYRRFMATVDTIVMGRNSFEQVRGFGEWPYGTMPVVVMSRRLPALPEDLPPSVSMSREAPAALVARLSARGIRHI